MCLLKNQLPDVLILRYTNALLKPNGYMLILTETFGFAFAHVPLYCLDLSIILLCSSDPLQQVWLHLKCCHKTTRNNLQPEFLELLTQLKWHSLSISNIDVALTAQCICNDICFTRMILHIQVIVLNKLQPSALPEVQLPLSEDVLQTLMISEYVTAVTNEIVPPCLQHMNNRCQLQVM